MKLYPCLSLFRMAAVSSAGSLFKCYNFRIHFGEGSQVILIDPEDDLRTGTLPGAI